MKRFLRLGLFIGYTSLLIGLAPACVWAQGADSLTLEKLRAKEMATQNAILQEDTLNSQGKRGSQFYTHVQKFFSRTEVLRRLYAWLFREPGNQARVVEAEKGKEDNPNKIYDGKIIGRIKVRHIDVFGPSVSDTLRPPQNWLERVGNRLHMDTRASLIKNNYLLFAEGRALDHQVLQNNERILRTSLPNLLDARIFVLPRPNSTDTVDVLVVTQDVWSISVDGSFSGVESADLNMEDINILGLGHAFRQEFSYSKERTQPWGYRGRYRIPYIGRSFMSAEGEYISEAGNRIYAIRLRKPFLAPTIKYAGGLDYSYNQVKLPIFFPTDTFNFSIPVQYKLTDLWLGRALRFYKGSENFQKSARLILASRLLHHDYDQGPEIKPDTNQYQGRTTGLFSVGFSRRNYFRDLYIYGFGRTEDVPYGSLLNLTFGVEKTALIGKRLYGGVNWVYAQYFPHFGYLYGNVHVGSYLRNRNWEQGALDMSLKYFSPLMGQKKLKIRQFVTARYRQGINRFYNEGIEISNHDGLRGIYGGALRGTESLVFNLETVFFLPGNLLGFRFTGFTYADFGLVTRQHGNLFGKAPFQGYGLGIRLRNEHLTFNTIQLRLGYYANIPDNHTPLRGDTAGFPSLRLSDLAISAPDVVPFR